MIRDFDEAIDKLALANATEAEADTAVVTQFADRAVVDLSALFSHAAGTDLLTLLGVTSFEESELLLL